MRTKQTGLLLRRGGTWARRLTWRQSGAPLDLSYLEEACFQVWEPAAPADAAPVAEARLSDGTITVFANSGTVDVFLNDTDDVPLGVYWGVLSLTFLDGTKQPTPPFLINVVEGGCRAPGDVAPVSGGYV
jgi:hypothetical protein